MSNITLCLIVIVFIVILYHYWLFPSDQRRGRFLGLLFCVILYNVWFVFLQDKIGLSDIARTKVSNLVNVLFLLCYGYYFFKEFNLNQIKNFLPQRAEFLLSVPFLSVFLLSFISAEAKPSFVAFTFSSPIVVGIYFTLRKNKINLSDLILKYEADSAVYLAAFVAFIVWVMFPIIAVLLHLPFQTIAIANVGFIGMAIVYLIHSKKTYRIFVPSREDTRYTIQMPVDDSNFKKDECKEAETDFLTDVVLKSDPQPEIMEADTEAMELACLSEIEKSETLAQDVSIDSNENDEFNSSTSSIVLNTLLREKFVANCLRFNLTKQEHKIADLVLHGLSVQEIADLLFISIHTVNTHQKNIRRKANAKNRIDLTQKLVQ
jgi:DNA-binding CsgD family transcriptional regulator